MKTVYDILNEDIQTDRFNLSEATSFIDIPNIGRVPITYTSIYEKLVKNLTDLVNNTIKGQELTAQSLRHALTNLFSGKLAPPNKQMFDELLLRNFANALANGSIKIDLSKIDPTHRNEVIHGIINGLSRVAPDKVDDVALAIGAGQFKTISPPTEPGVMHGPNAGPHPTPTPKPEGPITTTIGKGRDFEQWANTPKNIPNEPQFKTISPPTEPGVMHGPNAGPRPIPKPEEPITTIGKGRDFEQWANTPKNIPNEPQFKDVTPPTEPGVMHGPNAGPHPIPKPEEPITTTIGKGRDFEQWANTPESTAQAHSFWDTFSGLFTDISTWFREHFPRLTTFFEKIGHTIVNGVQHFHNALGPWTWPVIGGAITIILYWWLYKKYIYRKVAIETAKIEIDALVDYILISEAIIPGLSRLSLKSLLAKALRTEDEILGTYEEMPKEKRDPFLVNMAQAAQMHKSLITSIFKE